MRPHELLTQCLDGVREVVDLSPAGVDLPAHLQPPADLPWRRLGPGDTRGLDCGPGTLLVGVLGPDPEVHREPTTMEPVLERFREGARAVLLIGWPIDQFPYHRLLGPLTAARCQVRATVPLERATVAGGCSCAVVAECVSRLAPLRPYLSGTADAGPAGELPTVLRAVNEYLLADLVTRPLRRRLRDLEAEVEELRQRLPGADA